MKTPDTDQLGFHPETEFRFIDDRVFGHSIFFWDQSQSGQHRIIRWGAWREEYPQLRAQNGYQHQVSVSALADECLLRLRPYVRLDELLILRGFFFHDFPEGLLGIDVQATKKTDEDDLKEYIAFEKINRPLQRVVWLERQRAFLLQFCLKNPSCFPSDARTVMSELFETRRIEAYFFRAIEKLDYLYYAYEGAEIHGVEEIIQACAIYHMPHLDELSKQIPGFEKEIWTPEVKEYMKLQASRFRGDPRYARGPQLKLAI